MLKPALILLVLMPAFAFAQQKTDAASADKSLILALEGAWNQAEMHHDTNAAAAIMADTFVSVDHHGRLLDKSQYLTELKDPSFQPEEIAPLYMDCYQSVVKMRAP